MGLHNPATGAAHLPIHRDIKNHSIGLD